MGLIIAQLTPVAYPFTALAMAGEFWATKAALCRVWARPTSIDRGLMESLRARGLYCAAQRSIRHAAAFQVIIGSSTFWTHQC